MSFGLYLLFTTVLFLLFALWIRRLVVRRLEPERLLTDLRQEVAELVSEVNQAGDHNVSILEDRISELRTLVGDADRQIDELVAIVAAARDERSVSAASREAPQEPAAEGTGGDGPADDGGDGGEPVYTVQFAGRTVAEQVDEPSEDIAPEDAPPEESPRDAVQRLARQGLAPELIAGRTGMTIGEVELIISLGRQRSAR